MTLVRRTYSATPDRAGVLYWWLLRSPILKGDAALTKSAAWPPMRVAAGVAIVLDLGELSAEAPAVQFACSIKTDDGEEYRLPFVLRETRCKSTQV